LTLAGFYRLSQQGNNNGMVVLIIMSGKETMRRTKAKQIIPPMDVSALPSPGVEVTRSGLDI
jgi:hypothetical protein